MRIVLLATLFLFLVGCSQQVYVVRHAEKGSSETRPTDPPLSNEGTKRANDLVNLLDNKKIKKIYATPTQRAMLTGTPLSEATKIPIETYGPMPDQNFLHQIIAGKNNSLIIGHSNTVDDIVNGLMKSPQIKDLPENEYGNLYLIKIKNNKTSLKKLSY